MDERDGRNSAADAILEEGRPRWSQTLLNGLDILELVLQRSPSLAELARQTGLSVATTRRLSRALISRKILAMEPSGRLRAGPKLFSLTDHARSQTDLLKIARPRLQALSASTGHSTFLGRRDGDHSVHMHRSTGSERVTVMTAPGARRLLAETSLGRALLIDSSPQELRSAFAMVESNGSAEDAVDDLQECAKRGVVLCLGSAPNFVNGISSPVRDASGSIVAAISLVSTNAYLNRDRALALAPTVRKTAKEISLLLGHPSVARGVVSER